MPKTVATSQQMENNFFELEHFAENCNDDALKSEIMSLISEFVHDREHCEHCYGKVDEAWVNEGLIRSCNCKHRKLSA